MTFDNAVARISCAQICRANGIDRCSPVALESLSDIMTRFLDLLATTAMQAAQLKSNEACDLEDAVFALETLHIIPHHIDGADAEGISEFVAWLRGPATQRALHVSKIQQQTLSALGQAQGAAIAAQQGSNEMQGSTAKVDDHADWLRQMVNKQILMGHGQKYKHTVFGEGDPEVNLRIAGAEFMDEALAKRLGVTVGGGPHSEPLETKPAKEHVDKSQPDADVSMEVSEHDPANATDAPAEAEAADDATAGAPAEATNDATDAQT